MTRDLGTGAPPETAQGSGSEAGLEEGQELLKYG